MPSIVRYYPKPRSEHQSRRAIRGIKAAIYTAMADQTAKEMGLRIDFQIGGLC